VSQTPGRLERSARTLLRAYPAEYRHGRAEEIIGTLLEAAPPGRSFPAAREAWSLIAGGRHARATRNRRPGVKANVRLALLLGISTYLSAYFGLALAGSVLHFIPGQSWLTNTTLALGTAMALAPWLGSRAAATALAISAGALVAYGDLRGNHGGTTTMSVAEILIVMAVLAALSGGPVRLPRSWLWLPGAFPLALVAGRLLSPQHALGPRLEDFLELGALLLLAVGVVCWLITDARPAFALCLAVLLQAVTTTLPSLVYGGSLRIAIVMALLPYVAIVLPVLLPAAWLLLCRQKAPSRRPFPEP
jgi:hypothetical protein